MVNARRRDSLSTASITTELEVKMKANLSWRAIMRRQKKRPITEDVTTDTMVANLAPLPLPAPSSFATRTLTLANREEISQQDKRLKSQRKKQGVNYNTTSACLTTFMFISKELKFCSSWLAICDHINCTLNFSCNEPFLGNRKSSLSKHRCDVCVFRNRNKMVHASVSRTFPY